MESNNGSLFQLGEAEIISRPDITAAPGAFIITPDDAIILREKLKEFEDGKSDLRTTIVQQMITELYKLRPADFPFDKKLAGEVFAALL